MIRILRYDTTKNLLMIGQDALEQSKIFNKLMDPFDRYCHNL